MPVVIVGIAPVWLVDTDIDKIVSAPYIKAFNEERVHPDRRGFGVAVAGFPEGHPATPNRLLEMDYRFSPEQVSTHVYLGNLSSLDQQKAQTYRAWARLRTQLARIKILVLGVPE
jgi:hypothetical protein